MDHSEIASSKFGLFDTHAFARTPLTQNPLRLIFVTSFINVSLLETDFFRWSPLVRRHISATNYSIYANPAKLTLLVTG